MLPGIISQINDFNPHPCLRVYFERIPSKATEFTGSAKGTGSERGCFNIFFPQKTKVYFLLEFLSEQAWNEHTGYGL